MIVVGMCAAIVALGITCGLSFERVSYADIAFKAGFDFDQL